MDFGEGLSPRVRGNPAGVIIISCYQRSIPACAGEPPPGNGQPGLVEVYPRVCGGTGRNMSPAGARKGLSPRVRGNPISGRAQSFRSRSIPACAGEPAACEYAGQAGAVYPRVCGGTDLPDGEIRHMRGLSPRVRGNPPGPAPTPRRTRSIPACAGEPGRSRTAACRPGVYPRVCGGTLRRQSPLRRGSGLSPRVRGNHNGQDYQATNAGSIPACAGEPSSLVNTENPLRSIPACAGEPSGPKNTANAPTVYPRVCGGTPGGCRATGRTTGSIPACAGEPSFIRALAADFRVYPRVCGGTPGPTGERGPRGGLSPRVRGNLAADVGQEHIVGSIPACAGEPVIGR